MINKKILTKSILNGLLLECMKGNILNDSIIKIYIDELKKSKRIDLKQEEELKSFFLIYDNSISKDNYSNEDIEFLTRKLFSLYDIPNTEKIKLIYYGIKTNVFNEEQAKDLLKDFDLVSYHNELIIEFEKTLK